MMDAVEFLKERTRMCNYYMNYCRNCPGNKVEYCATLCAAAIELVPIVEQWAKDHPIKTRQSEFLKMFPNAFMDGQVLNLCPNGFEGRTDCTARYNCANCRREYWLQEVE